MNVLLVGAGRMGLRHLRGLDRVAASIHVVEPRAEAEADVRAAVRHSPVVLHRTLSDALGAAPLLDAAILATTAAGRLEDVQALVARGIPNLLIEKPVEQSRARMRALFEAIERGPARAWFNHYRRTLPGYAPLRDAGGPFVVTVSSGAMGLGCNGIHWIDFAIHLARARTGTLLFGEVEPRPIGSGRGTGFRDYGGRGVFAFDDGSRLMLSCAAGSSAPTTMSIVSPTAHWVVDQNRDRAVLAERSPGVAHPTYLYGKDYVARETSGLEDVDLTALTQAWITALAAGTEPALPGPAEVRLSYELLFDLLETSGERQFDFT